MSEPTLYPDWDTNLTHTTAVLAGHKTDGYVADEVPASDEFNTQLNLIGQWIKFLGQNGANLFALLKNLLPVFDTGSAPTDPEYTGQTTPTDSAYAYAVHGGQAFLRQGGANNVVQLAPGMLLQLSGGALLSYLCVGTESWTIANGDATNPRVDLLQMKIDNSTPVSTASFTVKQGTPAASPVYPTPDTGYCVVGAVVVPATYAAAAGIGFTDGDYATLKLVVHDQRVPLRVRAHTTFANDFDIVGTWTLNGSGALSFQAAGAGTPDMRAVLDSEGGTGRLVAIQAGFYAASAMTSRLQNVTWYNGGGGGTAATSATTLNKANMDFASANYSLYNEKINQFQALHSPSSGPTVQAAANGMGPPVWTNGKRGVDQPMSGSLPISDSRLALAFLTNPSGADIGPVTFFVAGGL